MKAQRFCTVCGTEMVEYKVSYPDRLWLACPHFVEGDLSHDIEVMALAAEHGGGIKPQFDYLTGNKLP